MSQIEKILQLEADTEKIIKIGETLWAKSDGGETFSTLNLHEKTVLHIEMLESQVSNGGFDQYFFNSSGNFCYETLDALDRIGAYSTKELLSAAIKSFPKQPIPKDIIARREIMQNLPGNTSQSWENLDDKFFSYPDDIEKMVIEFVKRNIEYFD